MDDAAVLAVLARADARGGLPQLGGMARPDGVAIVSESVWAFASVRGDVRVLPLPAGPSALRRLPFLRGLVKLAGALRPLFARGGSTGPRERLLLLALLLAPLGLHFLPERLSLAAFVATTLALLAFVFRGRTLFLHGAEHRAIAAAEARQLVATWHGRARPSRFSPRCGTNFAALLAPVTFLLERVWVVPTAPVTPVLVTLCSLMLTMELWLAIQSRASSPARVLLGPGLALQRLTTREPTLAETRVALRAVAAVLQHDEMRPARFERATSASAG
ncbi:MAG TPA: DUF1385 domain-containing protein, partial [Gaiellaceae bacterium]